MLAFYTLVVLIKLIFFNVISYILQPVEPACGDHHTAGHSLDLVTTLRSELAASTYKRDRLLHEISEIRSTLVAREAECEQLRSQTARQSTMIGSLQNRLQVTENRERTLQV